MAFEMETSRTADAAKLAVLWRDKDRRGGAGGSGVPDHFAEDIFAGGILPEVIQPPAGQPTTNPDGTTTPAVPPTPTLADHKTVFTDSQDLKSIYGALLDIRAWLAPVPNPTASLKTVPDMAVLIGGSVYTALKAIKEVVEDFEGRLTTVEGALSKAASDAAAARSAAESALDSVQRLDQRVTSQIQQLQRHQVSAENRIRNLEENYTSLSQRVGMLENGTSGQ